MILASIKWAWTVDRGDLLASALMVAALVAVIVFGSEPIGLGLVLVAAVLLNAGRIFYRAAVTVRETRHLNAYWDELFATRPEQWITSGSDPTDV